MDWTDERVEILKRLWKDGLSASQIASQLGGVTRNSVIGKVHRLNLTGRAKPASVRPRPRKTRPSAPPVPQRHTPVGNSLKPVLAPSNLQIQTLPVLERVPKPVPIEDLVVPISLNVSLLALNEEMCKWPIGDPGARGFHFCGHRQYRNLPYCEYHSRLAYQPVSQRQRERSSRIY